MTTRSASAEWKGTLKEGTGKFSTESKVVKGPYTFASRFETKPGTNPEELVAAAHAGCYSMFLSALLSKEKLTPTRINTTSSVTLGSDEKGPKITGIHLECTAKVSGITKADFRKLALQAKAKCPISRLYKGTKITLTATLI
jgi:osmotically inducible protein OsmC